MMEPGATEITVVAAVVCRHAKYLVCQRPTWKRDRGMWEIPGCKVNARDPRADAILRKI